MAGGDGLTIFMAKGVGIDMGWLGNQFPMLSNLLPLNSGGQKLVLSAHHRINGLVVLKLIHPLQDFETTQREALAANLLVGQRVPQILESGVISTQLGDCIWFLERMVEGSTVREMLATGKADYAMALRLACQILEILKESEKLRIVHRDIKPENVIADRQGDFWLIDFGLARHLDLSSLTGSGATFGKCTPGYAPPEQFNNLKRQIDSRCDLFSLGVMIYECAIGINPFRAGARDDLEILKRVETQRLPRLNFGVGTDGFSDLISAMTQPRRDHRPATALEAFNWVQELSA